MPATGVPRRGRGRGRGEGRSRIPTSTGGGEEGYGYIRISRKLFESDPFWTEAREFSRAEAWIDLIQMAAWKEHRRMVRGTVIRILRGQILASERFLADRWSWSRGRVRRFLDLMLEMERVDQQADHPAGHLGMILTLRNYDRYQLGPAARGPPNGPPTAPLADHPRTTRGPKRRKEEDTSSPLEARARARLAESLGPHADAVRAFAGQVRGSARWGQAILGQYGPEGIQRHVLRALSEEEAQAALATAMVRYAAESDVWRGNFFDSILRKVIDEQTGGSGARNGGTGKSRKPSKYPTIYGDGRTSG